MAAACRRCAIIAAMAAAVGAASRVAPPPGSADGVAVQAAVAAAIARGADEYVFPAAGDVWFGNQSLEVVEGQGLTLRGSATRPTTLWFSLGGGVQLLRCRNVTLVDISIDYTPVPYLQATIVGGVPVNSSFTVYDFELFPRSSPFGSQAASGAGHLWRAGEVVRPGDVPTIVPPPGAEVTNIAGTNVFQSLMTTIPGARVGDVVTYAGTYYWTLAISNSSGIVVEDVSIFSASGMAIVELDGACAHTYRRVRVVPRDGYMIASNRDILHSADCEHGPLVEQCTFSRACDDYVNVHTTIQTLHHSAKGLILVSPRIVTTDPGPENFTDRWYGTTAPLTNVNAGDTIECFDPIRQLKAAYTRHGTLVLASKPRELDLVADPALKAEVLGLPGAFNGPPVNASPPFMPWAGARAWTVAFVEATELPQHGESWLCDITRFSARGAILRNNTFASPIWSGIRFKSPGGLLKGNRFVSSGMLAVGTGALQNWQEGPIAQRNVMVMGNTFDNCTADHGGDNFVSADPRVVGMRVSDNQIRDVCGERQAPSYNSDEQCVALPLSVQYVPLPQGSSPSTPCESLKLTEGPSGLRAELVGSTATVTTPTVMIGAPSGCWNYSTFEGSVGVCPWQNTLARGPLLVCLGPNQPVVRVLCRGKLVGGALVTAARALVVPLSDCT